MLGRVKGVVLGYLSEDNPSAVILMQGDVILEVKRKWIFGIKCDLEIASRMAKDDNVFLLVYRNGSSFF